MRYRRDWTPGGCYFFTVVTAYRRPLFNHTRRVNLLRDVMASVCHRYPFTIDAMVVLPDHLHCIWTLPHGDADFALRWRRVKSSVSRTLRENENLGQIWQPRYWEHRIRDEEDFRHHVDYIHYNPVHHGLTRQPLDWPWSSIHKYLRHGRLEPGWGSDGIFLPACVGNE